MATFSRYACWPDDAKAISAVMDTEALKAEDHVFLATHQPMAMYRFDRTHGTTDAQQWAEGRTYTERDFLDDFQREPDFVFVPVLGDSGTGKSHLIRWLAANLKSTKTRRVVLIPKLGTNLKDILFLILKDMKGARFDEYRSRLSMATNKLNVPQARELLLSHLATLIGPNGNHRVDASRMSDEQKMLMSELPALFHDPYFRTLLLREGNIIDRLVIATVGERKKVERLDSKRAFATTDLQLNPLHVMKASAQARDIFQCLIAQDSLQKIAVDWINDHLDEAQTQVLNLGRDDLLRLMSEVREKLGEEGVELVLLIEDFAMLQGIDHPILEAVISKVGHTGKPLCAMRTALACTPGYFRDSPDTVRTRTTFRLSLDVGQLGAAGTIVRGDDVRAMVARYLNAVRVAPERLLEWAEGSDREDSPVPSACQDCKFVVDCHGSFGHTDGLGLYPFTAKALDRMLARVNNGVFNPRLLIKDVLKHVLERHRSDLVDGQFPTLGLHLHFGQPRLEPDVANDIQKNHKDDKKTRERRMALLDLWGDGDQFVDLRAGIHTAFDLPLLGEAARAQSGQTKTQPPKPQPPKPQPPKPGPGVDDTSVGVDEPGDKPSPTGVEERVEPTEVPTPPELQEKVDALKDWSNGGAFLAALQTFLRPKIFGSLTERIPWDDEFLLSGDFVATTKDAKKKPPQIFLQQDITFHNLQGKKEPPQNRVPLKIPLDPDDLREAAEALQGLILFDHFGHWKFEHGARRFRAYARQLTLWSDYLLDAIRRWPTTDGAQWDPVAPAVELLAVGARLAGRPAKASPETVDLVNAILTGTDTVEVDHRAPAWRELFEAFKKHRPVLETVVRSRIGCTKGGSREFKVLDAGCLAEVLEPLRKKALPQSPPPPQQLREDFADLRKFRDAIDQRLSNAVAEEKSRVLAWHDRMILELGPLEDHAGAIAALEKAKARAEAAGGYEGLASADFTAAIAGFKATSLANCLKAVERVRSVTDLSALFAELSHDHRRAMAAATSLLDAASAFLGKSISRAEREVRDFMGQGGDELDATKKRIDAALVGLGAVLEQHADGEGSP